MRSRTLVLLVVGALLVAGVGYAAVRFFSPADDHAVELVPADAVAYSSLFLKPSTDQRQAIRDLLERFPALEGIDGALEGIDQLLSRFFEEAWQVDYRSEVKPWLGTEVAAFSRAPQGLDTGGPTVAAGVLIQSTDDEAALETARRIEEQETADRSRRVHVPRSYRGHNYLVESSPAGPDPFALGTLDGFLFLGTERGLRASVDAAEDGKHLGDSERFRNSIEELPEDRVALFYLDIAGLLESLPPNAGTFTGPLRAVAATPFAGVLYARDDGVVLEVFTAAAAGAASRSPTKIIEEVPAESWGAIGIADLGRTTERILDSVSGIPGLGTGAITAFLRQQTGVDLIKDVLSWLGDSAVYAAGEEESDLSVGGVLEATDPKAAQRAVARVGGLLRARFGQRVSFFGRGYVIGFRFRPPREETPVSVFIHRSEPRRVQIVAGLVRFGDRLGIAEEFTEASSDLGEGFDVSGYFGLQAIRRLVESAGDLPPDYEADVAPNLDPVRHIVIGSRRDGDTVLYRLVIGVK